VPSVHLAELAWRDRRPAPHALLAIAAASAVLSAICVLAIDQPVARWIATFEPRAFWDRGIELLEWTVGLPFFKLFAPVVLVAGMLVTMAVPRLRGQAPGWMLVAGTHLASRYLTNVVKDATGRLRPLAWIEQGGGDTFGAGGIAFPSGHVALFASIVIPLVVVAPRTRPLLAVVAFVMVARVAVDGHWISDTLGAITLVALVTWALGYAVRPRRT